MTNGHRKPPERLLTGRRALEGMRGVRVLNDWAWYASVNKWALHARLSPNITEGGPIPPETDWYILVEEVYPRGSVKFHPARIGGLKGTFPHQAFNGGGDSALPWTAGAICLDTQVRLLGRHGHDTEPRGVHDRLRWQFHRAIRWLEAASRGELILRGEPFELPQFPPCSSPIMVAFCEGRETFPVWQDTTTNVGLVDLSRWRETDVVLCATCYRSVDNKVLLTPSWGEAVRRAAGEPLGGVWLRVKQVPVVYPWQAPTTWGELRSACGAQGTDIDDLLGSVASFLRDRRRHIALVGFPVPQLIGGHPCQVHWQAIMLPTLSFGPQTKKGFRANETGRWLRDRAELLHAEAGVDWLRSENWDVDQISTRGRLSASVTSKRVLLIGAGAVGSALGELLIRAGVRDLAIMDQDPLEAGNLVRHSLTLDDVKQQKASALAGWLNKLTPFASVQTMNSDFPPIAEADTRLVQGYEIVIDCTAEDEVLHRLHSFPWEQPKLFVSVSLGRQANRLFVFVARADKFPHLRFSELINPWLTRESDEYSGEDWPTEGIGCWHPVFPARIDDVRMLVSIALKQIESAAAQPPAEPQLVIFEQRYERERFCGVRRVYA